VNGHHRTISATERDELVGGYTRYEKQNTILPPATQNIAQLMPQKQKFKKQNPPAHMRDMKQIG